MRGFLPAARRNPLESSLALRLLQAVELDDPVRHVAREIRLDVVVEPRSMRGTLHFDTSYFKVCKRTATL
jgi:hypothetical protein